MRYIWRKFRRLVEMPVLVIKWWLARRLRIRALRVRGKAEIFAKLEELHGKGIVAQRQGRAVDYVKLVGMKRALLWVVGEQGENLADR